MPYFTKKPVTIEARQYHGTESSAKDIIRWIVDSGREAHWTNDALFIETLEGTHRACLGDWIIKGVAGEFYPCKYAIFEQTYEPTIDHH
jgi:hypothetical protein